VTKKVVSVLCSFHCATSVGMSTGMDGMNNEEETEKKIENGF
jgi:hypothetical protein